MIRIFILERLQSLDELSMQLISIETETAAGFSWEENEKSIGNFWGFWGNIQIKRQASGGGVSAIFD